MGRDTGHVEYKMGRATAHVSVDCSIPERDTGRGQYHLTVPSDGGAGPHEFSTISLPTHQTTPLGGGSKAPFERPESTCWDKFKVESRRFIGR